MKMTTTTVLAPTPASVTAPLKVPNFGSDNSDRKLAIICSKGNLDMAYPALILGNAALGEGIETHLFFTFWGFDLITKSRMNHLQFSPMGNTAMHVPGMNMHIPQAMTLEQIVAAGGHLWACRLSAEMNKLTQIDLRDDVEGIISASDFMELTDGAQLLFI
jgi:peroxiredoxin family protein